MNRADANRIQLTFGLSVVCVYAGLSNFAAAADEHKPQCTASLAYLLTDPASPQAEGLSQCDKLTIAKYRESGCTITEKTHAEFTGWLESDGKEWSKAHPNFQRLAYAKLLKADAIGGLETTEFSLDEGAAPKQIFMGWGLALKSCSGGGGGFDMEAGDKVRAIPLFGAAGFSAETGDSARNWGIPTRIDPTPCSASDSMRMMMPSSKGRPFLGVRLNGTTLSEVVPDSPALAAGLKVGDTLARINGQAMVDMNSLRDVMKDRKPGDELEVEYVRDGTSTTKKITLADYYDVVEVKQAREGKPLPALSGKDIDGKEIHLADLKGKVVLLDFWATWCSPCKEEMPLLQLLHEQIKANDKDKEFVWISVSVDDDEQAWRDFVRNNKLGGIHLRSQDWAGDLYVSGFPTVILVDRAGVMQCELRGDRIAQAALAMVGK